MLHYRRTFALAFTALAFSPAASFAASATQTGYDDDSDVVVQDDNTDTPQSDTQPADTATPAPAATNSSSSLPFTGLEAGLIAAAGLGLAGTGLVLRRAASDE